MIQLVKENPRIPEITADINSNNPKVIRLNFLGGCLSSSGFLGKTGGFDIEGGGGIGRSTCPVIRSSKLLGLILYGY